MPWAPSARTEERRRSGRHRSGLGALIALALSGVSLLTPLGVRAATATLSDGSVTPGSGTTATVFTFSVHYSNDHPFATASVAAVLTGGEAVGLAPVGDPDDGIWQGSSTLPAGSWAVTFVADASQGPDPTPLDGPVVVVAPLSTPVPTPIPTVLPTPVPPTAVPTLRPTPAPAPGGPAPTPAEGDPGPTFVPRAQPSPSGGIGEVRRVGGDAAPVPSVSPGGGRQRPESLAAASAGADPNPDVRDGVLASTSDRHRGGALPWIVLGGGMSAAGALILGRQAWLRRARGA